MDEKTNYFKPNRRGGKYYDVLNRAIEVIEEKLKLNFGSSSKEKDYENRVAGALLTGMDELDDEIRFIDQRDVQETLTRITLCGYDHRPDMSFGRDGIAIEIKRLSGSQSVREFIGQTIVYRNGYRFVIGVLIDERKNKPIKKRFEDPTTEEYKLKEYLESIGVFLIVK